MNKVTLSDHRTIIDLVDIIGSIKSVADKTLHKFDTGPIVYLDDSVPA